MVPARAQPFPPDPVEGLRRILRNPLQIPVDDPALLKRLEAAKPEERLKLQGELLERSLADKIQAIQQIGDLRRALLLQEWPAEETRREDEIGTAERRAREKLVVRFRNEVRSQLKEGNLAARLAVLNMLADLRASFTEPEAGFIRPERVEELKRLRTQSGLGEPLAPDVAELVVHGQTREDRLTAAYALGQMLPDPKIAAPAFRSLLRSQDVLERRAGAGALAGWAKLIADISARGRIVSGPQDVVNAGVEIAPIAGQGVSDSDPRVRRLCAEAFDSISSAMTNQAPQTQFEELPGGEISRGELEEARKGLMPLMQVLKGQAGPLAAALADSDPQVRSRARKALQEMGIARQRISHMPGAIEPGPPAPIYRQGTMNDSHSVDTVLVALAAQTAAAPDDPLLAIFRETMPALARGIQDPVVQNRRAAIDAIEMIGSPAAVAAAPALVEALCDPDPFVRWSAARTLGKIGPIRPSSEVPVLACLLSDIDVDVRRAAAVALERYGPAAEEAVPALIRMLKADHWVLRLQAVQSLGGIGNGAAPAIPALAQTVADTDFRVRRSAAELLGRFGPTAKQAVPALERALGDTNADVRKAASDALLSITTGK
jgi:HEAT repeat protein